MLELTNVIVICLSQALYDIQLYSRYVYYFLPIDSEPTCASVILLPSTTSVNWLFLRNNRRRYTTNGTIPTYCSWLDSLNHSVPCYNCRDGCSQTQWNLYWHLIRLRYSGLNSDRQVLRMTSGLCSIQRCCILPNFRMRHNSSCECATNLDNQNHLQKPSYQP